MNEATHELKFSMGTGCLFLAGGIANIVILSLLLWLTILDHAGAYIPGAYFGGKLIE